MDFTMCYDGNELIKKRMRGLVAPFNPLGEITRNPRGDIENIQ